jgi:hypothetical protein
MPLQELVKLDGRTANFAGSVPVSLCVLQRRLDLALRQITATVAVVFLPRLGNVDRYRLRVLRELDGWRLGADRGGWAETEERGKQEEWGREFLHKGRRSCGVYHE